MHETKINRVETEGSGFKALEARYRLPLRRFFERRLRNKPDPDDLVQEVFLRMVRRGATDNIQSLDRYVFQIAANVLRDYARRWAIRSEEVDHAQLDDLEVEGGFSPERVLLGREAIASLIAALQELPEKTIVIFSLYHFDSISQVEIAKRFGMSVSTVEKHMSRANAHLLERLRRADEV